MAPKKRRISSLIDSQLPGFITNEYENFSKFIEKYYEHLESAGQPLDIISNLDQYKNIDYYEEHLLKQSTTLTANVNADATTIFVDDATSFPKENGYIKIGNEILFYQERTDNQFLYVSRGVSGNTTLGDLYHSSTFVTTAAQAHYTGDVVQNISNLFLYALVKEFEKTYLGSFPEAYLKRDVDKRTLIKNIGKFYRAKGTDRSIKFIFNSIISQTQDDVPEVFNPKDFTLKSSVSDWVSDYILKVKVTSGNPFNLVGRVITQELDSFDETLTFASAVVDNVIDIGDDFYQLVLEPSTINGQFKVASETTTTTATSNTLTTGDRINVKSTFGFPQQGKILLGDEVIVYSDKTVNQFIIDNRVGPIRNHGDNETVYSYSSINDGNGVRLTSFGLIYNLIPSKSAPYSSTEDFVEVSESGFKTLDPIIFNRNQNRNRWLINTDPDLNPTYIKGVQSKYSADIGAILEDDQYYYICSSGYPKGNLLVDTNYTEQLNDQKHLKLIRKKPITTTEVYTTPSRDVGIFIDGAVAIGYKDTDGIKYGPIVSTSITNRGVSYAAAPYVLIDEVPGKARANLAGSVVDSIEILTTENYKKDPTIRITSGEGAILSPVITNGAITSIDIVNPGRYYSSPPKIIIIDTLGKGNFAEYEAILSSKGEIESVRKISKGRFYTRGYTTVIVEPAGKNASATAEIKKWVYDRYNRVKNNLDSSNGTILRNYNLTRDYGYGYIANPINVRKRAYLTQSEYTSNVLYQNVHSPILGYAYDGNPIYGPYGYSNPTNPNSSITRLSSGYQLKSSRPNGPDTGLYPLGTFVDDYKWIPSVNSGKTELDVNNGRFCVTPDYPNGTYAYFITVDQNEVPKFPYIIGLNYYSLPVDSNYNSDISQDDIPANLKALKTSATDQNGFDFSGLIKDVEVGNISGSFVESSPNNFSPGNAVHVDNTGTDGSGSVLTVKEVTGKNISSIESVETKASRVFIQESAYLFAGDKVQQIDIDGTILAQGYLIGDVINSNDLVLRNSFGTFVKDVPVDSDTLVIQLVLSQNSNFTVGSTMTLTNDDKEVIATGLILETITRQNSVKIKVTSGEFIVTEDYYLRSTNLSDTNRSKIISIQSLSTGLTPYLYEDNLAIVETSEPHGLGSGDMVDVTITPNDIDSTTQYYVRKRLYQNVSLIPPVHRSTIVDTGVGSAEILNSGKGYTTDVYYDVELIFQDQTKTRNGLGAPGNSKNAKATVVVSNPGGVGAGVVSSIILSYKGSGYKRGDILTVSDASLSRVPTEESSQRLVVEVTHSGFAFDNTELRLTNVTNLSKDDYIKIGNEILLITKVDIVAKSITVSRGQKGTIPQNYFDGSEVSLYESFYRLENGFRPFGESPTKPYLISYDKSSHDLSVAFEYSVSNPQILSISCSFFDQSIPAKLVSIKSVEESKYKLEFSKDQFNFDTNPVIKIQKYYKYIFDVSHPSMGDTYLDFSSSSNYNIFTEEKEVSTISPGNAGSYVSIKLGFGPAISSNTYQERKPINFQNYFYFIKVSPDVDTGGSYLSIVDDPLSGPKKVLYTTDTRFVYSVDNVPAYDGTGSMTYTTSSTNAVGSIVSLKIINTGGNYKKLPIISGISPTLENEAIVDPVWDPLKKQIVGFNIIKKGSGYVNPIVVIIDGDGINYEYECDSLNGELTQVRIKKPGSGFTYKPTVRIAEGNVRVYLESKTIGVPKNVKINNPGRGYNSDTSTTRFFKGATTLALKNISDTFFAGEVITQDSTGAKAVVTNEGWKDGSNLLKVRAIQGIIENGEIRSLTGNRTAYVYDQYTTEFSVDLRSYVDNFGSYAGDRGKISSANQRLQDSYYYQDYSYVIKSKTSIEVWRDLIKETTHPAGFQMFSEMVIDSKADIPMPVEQSPISHYTVIELPALDVTSLSSKYQSTTSWVKFDSISVENGTGSVSVDTFDTSETRVYDLKLTPEFDGEFDSNTGQLVGTKIFTLVDKNSNSPVVVDKPEQLIITLDGIWQEPGVSYTVNGNQIEFSSPPFGKRIVEGQETNEVKFYGRLFKFKNPSLTDRYFRKVQNISDQFDGVQFVFDLYWEDDGTPVKTDPNENFLVGLNGVIQKARMEAGIPYGNSYQIERSNNVNVPDKIIFSKPPIDNEDAYGPPEEIPESLKNYEHCFIYSVGSYERLTIQSELYEYRFGGPYLILDEITKSVRKIDESKYALVFIDGVLQREGDSYQIVGPNITFTENLLSYKTSGNRIYQNVSIILLYGRDIPKTLTFYDFEPYTFNNSIIVNLSGTNVTKNFLDVYAPNSLDRNYVKQGNVVVGKVLNVEIVSSDEINIVFSNPKNIELSQDSLELVNLDVYDTNTNLPEVITIPGSYTISYEYKTDEDGDRILERFVSPWLYGSSLANATWNNKFSLLGNLLPGDKILIDGESSFREVLRTPDTGKTTSYRNNDLVQNGYFAKVLTSDYEGDTQGVGLSVTANVNAFGEVTTLNVSDVEWNKRDFNLYLETGILLQPTAYEYFTTPEIHFIPVDGNGGGAKAEVIAHGGQILDIVITDPGSGYTQPPKVVVARRFKRIKESSRKIDSLTVLDIQTSIDSVFVMVGYSEVKVEGGPFSLQSISSVITFGGFNPDLNTNRDITTVVATKKGQERKVKMTDKKFPSQIRIEAAVSRIEPVQHTTNIVATQIVGGVVGFEALASLQTISTEEVIKIIQIKANKAFRQERADSINGVGTFLDAPMDLDDTIAYVPNTARFPDTPSRLRIGREVIYYTSKKSDRFLGLTRGYQDSILEPHNAGDLVLHYPEFVTLLSGGVNTIISEVTVASSTSAERKSTVTFELISEIQSVKNVEIDLFGQTQFIAPPQFEPNVREQIVIIPPTSVNIVTNVHSTKTTVLPLVSDPPVVAGFVSSKVVTLTDLNTELTQQDQIQLDTSSTVSSVTIGSVAATASSSSHIVSSSYAKTDEITTIQVLASIDISSISTVITQRVSTIDEIQTYASVISTIAGVNTRVIKFTSDVYTQQPFVMYVSNEITASLQDIDTFTSRVTMILGGINASASAGVKVDYKSGVLDYIIEEYVLEEKIKLQNGSYVFLNDPYNEVILRNSGTIFVENKSQITPDGLESYSLGNAGLTLGSFESNIFVDSGVSSGLSLEQLQLGYPSLTIDYANENKTTALLSNGNRFNIGIPSYQQPVTNSLVTGTIGGSLSVKSTQYFATSGYLFTSSGNVIQYTGKTATTFVGCSVLRGSTTINTDDEIIPFIIV